MPHTSSTNPFPGAHVLITGAASGIGAALAAAAAGAGAAAVSVVDRDAAGGARVVAALLAAAGPGGAAGPAFRAAAFVADVTEEEQVKVAVAAAVAAHGPIGVLFANAGIGPAALFLDAPPSHFARVFAVNVQGTIHTLAAALPAMAADAAAAGGAQRRAVLLCGSTAGFASAAGLSAYCASKAALRSLAGCLRLEMAGLAPALSVHLATPGFADTPLVAGGTAGASPAAGALHAALVPPVLPSAGTVASQILAGMAGGAFLIPAGGPGAAALAAVSRDPGGPGVAWVGGGGWVAAVANAVIDAAAAVPLVAASAWFRGMLKRKTAAALASVGLGKGAVPVTKVAVGGGGRGKGGEGGGGVLVVASSASSPPPPPLSLTKRGRGRE